MGFIFDRTFSKLRFISVLFTGNFSEISGRA